MSPLLATGAALLLLLCMLGAFALHGLSDFELKNARVSALTFHAGNAELSGTLVMPRNAPNAPIALLIHGDGPRDRFSEGGYLPLINALLDAGIGVFTWDKAGIDQSSGDWLAQSMQDRADEAVVAMTRVRQAIGPNHKIGLLGFSQGGWVIPRVASEVRPAFSVIVGGAVNWRRQGVYLTQQRLRAQGVPPTSIDAAIAAELKSNDRIFSRQGEPADPNARPDIEPHRFAFIARNYAEDSSTALATMHGPVLAAWGALDRNVDPVNDANSYARAFADHSDRTITLVRNATHALLRARWFDYQLESQWPKWKVALFMCLGRHAYAPGALTLITDWIKSQ
ncbi:alpha/beta hydrolase [Cupriavidus basilensis]|uniref:Alpha/beta hydrolase n=1 Tax=Cupriavidus basilensis TaxID=68895 RepID=A0ABT6AG44_9BURK|nr:alpha/beta hydrolase [Cupriavidus basilensis]MDF3831572.1 alpha/beta hydrolase [Cupriavidus basilensis]